MPRKKKEERTKPMGATRTRIETGVAKLDKLKNHYTALLEKFTTAIQSSINNTQLIRYAVEDFVKEADTIQETNETYYLGDWLKKSGKQLKQASELLHTFNQGILEGFIHTADKFVKEEYPPIKASKKNFDKICHTHDSVRTKLNNEQQKKKVQEKKVNELTTELTQQKKLKDTVKNSAVVEIEELEEKIYRTSVYSLMDIMENLAKYFDEGTRLCKRSMQDVEVGREDFEKHLKDRSQGKVESAVKRPSVSPSDFADSAPVVKEVDGPRKKEKLSRSQKIVQQHKQRYNLDLKQAENDPALGVLLKAIFEENVYQQNLGDIIKLFQEPLEVDPNWTSKVTKEQVEAIFGNMKEIQKIHLGIHASYRDCQQNWPKTSVCAVLNDAVSQFGVYVPTLINYNAATARIEHLAKKGKQFNSFFNTSEVSLLDLMKFPTGILDTYLSLVELAKEQASTKEDKQLIKQAEDAIKGYRSRVEGNESNHDAVIQLLDVQDQIIDFSGPSLDSVSFRRLLRSGKVTLQVSSPDEEESSPKGKHNMFLCNDIMICCKKADGKKKLKLVASTNLQLCVLKEGEDKNTILLVEQQAKNVEKEYTFFLNSKEEKEWYKTLSDAIAFTRQNKILGIPLDELMKKDREKGNIIPSLLEDGTTTLVSSGALKKEGLIRVSASASEIMQVAQRIDSGKLTTLSGLDPHIIVCLLKKFFRDLPDPIFTRNQFKNFLDAAALEDPDEKLIEMQVLIEELPPTNQFVLQHMFAFFSLLASYSEENKMNSQNIAVVMAPIMLHSGEIDPSMMTKQNLSISVIKYLIDNSKEIFANIKSLRQELTNG